MRNICTSEVGEGGGRFEHGPRTCCKNTGLDRTTCIVRRHFERLRTETILTVRPRGYHLARTIGTHFTTLVWTTATEIKDFTRLSCMKTILH